MNLKLKSELKTKGRRAKDPWTWQSLYVQGPPTIYYSKYLSFSSVSPSWQTCPQIRLASNCLQLVESFTKLSWLTASDHFLNSQTDKDLTGTLSYVLVWNTLSFLFKSFEHKKAYKICCKLTDIYEKTANWLG